MSFEKFSKDMLINRLGSDLCALLNDTSVLEIMLNCDGSLFVEKNGFISKIGFISSVKAHSVIRTMATIFDTEISYKNSIVSGHMPFFNARFEGVLPPLVKAPSFTIRKHHKDLLTIDTLILKNMLTYNEASFLRKSIKERRSIIVAGATSSGKTTLVNALINEIQSICPNDRIISIEDTPELLITQANHINLFTTDTSDMSLLLKESLRMRPDRIVVGEVRGAEALDLIDAMSTGHKGGLCTVHAGSIDQTLMRLVLLISRHKNAPRFIEPFLVSALDLIVQLENKPTRHIASIATDLMFNDSIFTYNKIF